MIDNGEFDLFSSRSARDKALSKVSNNAPDYMTGGLSLIANLPHGTVLIGEDIRIKCRDAKLVPHHHNAHGALIKQAIKIGLLRPTGHYRQMKSVTSHARRTAEYRVHSRLEPLPLLDLK